MNEVVKRNATDERDIVAGHLELNDQILDSQDLSLKDRVKLFNLNSNTMRGWAVVNLSARKLRAQQPELMSGQQSLLTTKK